MEKIEKCQKQQQQAKKIIILDFDNTLSQIHLYRYLKQKGAETEINQLIQLKTENKEYELDQENFDNDEFYFTHQIVFGGWQRINLIASYLKEMKQLNCDIIVVSKGFVGVITKCLAESKLLQFFSMVYGNIANYYSYQSSKQDLFPDEREEHLTWLFYFCNPLIKEVYVELLESQDEYRKQLGIEYFYYFHQRIVGKRQKNVVDNKCKEVQEQRPIFACYEVANYDEEQDQSKKVGKEIQERKPFIIQNPHKFHRNLVETCVALQFDQERSRKWIENNLGLGLFPTECVKSSIDLTSLNKNNLFQWERTMPYTDEDETEFKSRQQHYLLISFNPQAALDCILNNSSIDLPQEDEMDQEKN
ncbi:HAD-like domain [Pseudocohnilembus persalinus]|uniref:HAD-like domain n=1 Tax=Pseudocohnilembus persalinus TaxID=266149 RepID=A0A0V0QBL3_PSEPJ|nr:HAD-like domain [Pseudocohnilembus persalinus]|eukprot:KRW99605.1 HAD-like domain [Pseudocohnilembus persalinus]